MTVSPTARRLLLTWTHRSNVIDDDGYGTGTRGLISYDDGTSFDFGAFHVARKPTVHIRWPEARAELVNLLHVASRYETYSVLRFASTINDLCELKETGVHAPTWLQPTITW